MPGLASGDPGPGERTIVRRRAAPPSLFGPELFRFLAELAQNNRREWFRSQRDRCREQVEAPSLAFVRAVAPGLVGISPHILCDPRPIGGSVMRIYRNVRFSRDKTPYRTSVGIRFMHDGATNLDQTLPGFFLHLAPGNCYAVAGVWEPDREGLARIRRAIVARRRTWGRVRARVPSIEGDTAKRPPPGFDPDQRWAEDLRRTSFASRIRFRETDVTRPGFPVRFVRACERLAPLNRFLAGALDVPY